MLDVRRPLCVREKCLRPSQEESLYRPFLPACVRGTAAAAVSINSTALPSVRRAQAKEEEEEEANNAFDGR